MKEASRDVWGKQIEFILTLVGYAVGLGNVWRFPYLCFKNGGGAFLIPYFICLVLLGIPMFALECAFGQYGGKGPVSIWSVNPLFKGLGLASVLVSVFIFIYYNVIIAQALRFFVASLTSDLPWIDCRTCDCLLYGQNNVSESVLQEMKTNNSLGITCDNLDPAIARSPSEIYYTDDILKDSGTIEDLGSVRWELLVCNLVAYLVIFLVLVKGIASLGKIVYFTATFPYILLTIILVRVAMLDGASVGVEYYLKPDWNQLTKASVWSDAATQVFFSLSCCQGGLIAMASYNKFDNNIIRDAFVVPIINCLTSIYAGFVVFCTLGYMANLKGVPIDNVTTQGPGLVFVVYPEAIGAMPVSTLWAVMFFFMLSLLGFSTQFSIAETIMTSFTDEFPGYFQKHRCREVVMRLCVCLTAFVLGVPMCTQGGQYLLTMVDEAALGYPMLIVGLLEMVVIAYVYGYSKFSEDIQAMVGFKPFKYFTITWCGVSPVLLMAVIVFKAYDMKEFDPVWEGVLYYLIVVVTVMWIPGGFLYYGRHALKEAMSPQKEWSDRRQLSKYQQEEDQPTAVPREERNGGHGADRVEMVEKDVVVVEGQYDNVGYLGEQ